MSTKIIPPSPSADDYASHGDRPLIADVADPFALFEDWMAEARKTEPNDCNAMSLATVDAAGMPDRAIYEQRVAEVSEVYGDGPDIPRPDFWGGYRLTPTEIEFWQDQAFRMHDRVKFIRHGDTWARGRLFP